MSQTMGVPAGSEDYQEASELVRRGGRGLRHIRRKGKCWNDPARDSEEVEWAGWRMGRRRPRGIPCMRNDPEGWRKVESTVQALVSMSQDLD